MRKQTLAGRFAHLAFGCSIATYGSFALCQEVPPIVPERANANPPVEMRLQDGQAPGQADTDATNEALRQDQRTQKLFGDISQIDDLPRARISQALSPAADAVFGPEATGRKTADLGDLLNRSKSTRGVTIQQRTPIVSETRVRGQRVGQVLASGSYWAPARMDLDTMMSKIDSRLIDNAILIKGPYAASYGPGHRFVDLDFIHSPRFASGQQLGGLTSANYNTNGQQWSGRQSIWGGGYDYGFHVSYGHRTGNDYETGAGFTLPTSYKSRDIFAAIGKDISAHESIEFNLIRLDQTDVEFPGLVFDLDFLVTDGYEVTYTNDAPGFADRFTAEVWYNRTRFEGDTLRAGKNAQIPTLVFDLFSPSGTNGFAITDGDSLSAGYRFESSYLFANAWGYERELRFGTDLIFLNQELNDIEPLAPATDNNFPIPRSHSLDIGVYMESVDTVSEQLTIKSGMRFDGVITDAEDNVDGVPVPVSTLKFSDLDQDFILGSAFVTGNYRLNEFWTLDVGGGFSMRPPTLTELYVDNSFIGSLQRGLTFLEGDPRLKSEKSLQVDIGTQYDDQRLQLGLFGHHAWIHDYITYDLIAPGGGIDGFPQGAAFVNTDIATLAGVEAYGQYEVLPAISVFGNISYVEGRDHARNDPARLSTVTNRSNVNLDQEPLPGIAPLESRLGLLIQDPSPQKRWGVEYAIRIVDNQDRIATSLEEVATPGFTTMDLRTFYRFRQLLLTAGVENLTDKFYQEHIDYRTGLGVFRPGVSFYFGTEITY